MPLSEKEQRILDELEKQLSSDDPTLAHQFGEPEKSSSFNTRRVALGGGIIVAGLALLIFAVSLPAVWLGVLAFVVMVVGAFVCLSSESPKQIPLDDPRRMHPSFTYGASKRGAKGSKAQSSFMKKLEQRWDERGRER
ncbi:DUF3040 domain-containing protein [Dermabacter vaginalis]|uniref:DUF3040 domain-containing protein n=1 Tax=Dermabacter TaxID=36739 RepID=UPI000F878371|nr:MULTISPECIES: DUF3040 domain-containing protein [Dermabacter]MCG7444068.1 DUF3040 domain-containing protein [Dermabacter vaginalis]MCT2150483.1 DUF3040 domain-containing protein [Dermabacter vaginalis]RUP85608.1 DUF3040 domain-containing protein [Dermabacter sp. HSID17554]